MSSESQSVKKLPTPEEIDALAVFPPGDPECAVLCLDLRATAEELQTTTDTKERWILIARLKAINARMRVLHCPICLPE